MCSDDAVGSTRNSTVLPVHHAPSVDFPPYIIQFAADDDDDDDDEDEEEVRVT